MVFVKLMLIVAFIVVFLQDHKERQVYWFLFPVIGALSGALFYASTLPELFYISIFINIGFILFLVLTLYLYAHFKLKTKLTNTIGVGDLLLFAALSVSFSTISFIMIFIFAMMFSLVLHLMYSKGRTIDTVPLAGYMSVFFLVSHLFHWAGFINDVYIL